MWSFSCIWVNIRYWYGVSFLCVCFWFCYQRNINFIKWEVFLHFLFSGFFLHVNVNLLKNFFSFIFISCRLIILQDCSGFCHTLTWISHGFTCIPHPSPPSHLPLHPIPLGLPSAPGPSTCLMHPTWAGDLFHPR